MRHTDAALDIVLRSWPAVRAQWAGRGQATASDLYAVITRLVPAATAAEWPTLCRVLVKYGLLHPVRPEVFAFEAAAVAPPFQPVLEPSWRELWRELAQRLTFRPGCLWATHWLAAYFPACPPVLVLEVSRGELRAAAQLVEATADYRVINRGEFGTDNFSRPTVLIQAFTPHSPVRTLQGVRIAGLEKILVDTEALTDAAFGTAAAMRDVVHQLEMHSGLHRNRLLEYASSQNRRARWNQLLLPDAN